VRVVPFLIYLILIVFHQVIFRDLSSIYNVSFNLAGFFILCIALYKDEFVVLWFGFAAGIVVSAGDPQQMGWFSLMFAFIGFIAFHVRGRLNLESMSAKLGLIAGGIFLCNIGEIIINGSDNFIFQTVYTALPSTIYTSVVAWLFFLFKEKRITTEKFKSLF